MHEFVQSNNYSEVALAVPKNELFKRLQIVKSCLLDHFQIINLAFSVLRLVINLTYYFCVLWS